MSFRVQMTASAQADLERLVRQFAEHSRGGADRFTARFSEALNRLESSPQACGLAYENPSFEEEIRHLLIRVQKRRTYRALFLVRGEDVVIVAVRAPGERPVVPKDLDTPG